MKYKELDLMITNPLHSILKQYIHYQYSHLMILASMNSLDHAHVIKKKFTSSSLPINNKQILLARETTGDKKYHTR